MLDAMDLCTAERGKDGRTVYDIDPTIMYPAVIERLKEIKAGAFPKELVSKRRPNAMAIYISQIKRYDNKAFELALVPREEVPDNPEIINLRIAVLTTAWKFFKFVLRESGAETSGTNNVLNVHLLNENAGTLDANGQGIKSAFRH